MVHAPARTHFNIFFNILKTFCDIPKRRWTMTKPCLADVHAHQKTFCDIPTHTPTYTMMTPKPCSADVHAHKKTHEKSMFYHNISQDPVLGPFLATRRPGDRFIEFLIQFWRFPKKIGHGFTPGPNIWNHEKQTDGHMSSIWPVCDEVQYNITNNEVENIQNRNQEYQNQNNQNRN